jgi:hypothetical protein
MTVFDHQMRGLGRWRDLDRGREQFLDLT